MRDICQLCVKGDAKWIVLDDKPHVYWELYLTKGLKVDLKRRVEEACYLACEPCRRQIERYNKAPQKSSYGWRRRKVTFLPWS